MSLLLLVIITVNTQLYLVQSNNLVNNAQCQEHLNKLIADGKDGVEWALQMSDASTKIPTGLLKGNVIDAGYFEECLEIEHVTNENDAINGKHCFTELDMSLDMFQKNSKENEFERFLNYLRFKSEYDVHHKKSSKAITAISVRFSYCIPDQCTIEEYMEKIGSILPLPAGINFELINASCQTINDAPSFTGGDIGASVFFAILLVTLVASTLYDLSLFQNKREPAHPILTSFSCFSNGKKFISVSKSDDQLSCLHGIRFITMCIVVYAHRCSILVNQPVMNGLDVMDWMLSWNSQLVAGISVAGDTYFLLSGILLTYRFLNSKESGAKFCLFKFYVHRYLRLVPVMGVLIIFHVTFLKHVGSGALWPEMREIIEEPCQKNWWLNLLFLQNYVNSDQICMAHSWFFAADTQLYILSPLILIPLTKWPKKTLIAVCALMFATMGASFGIAWEYDLSPLGFSNDYNTKYYYVPHTRAATWLLGIIMGYYIYQYKGKPFEMDMRLNIFGWVASFIIMNTVVVGPQNMKFHDYDKFESAIFIALHRVAWAVGAGWIIWGCLKGYGGITDWVLSLPAFQVLGKLTYCMYLIHVPLQYMLWGSQKVTLYFNELLAMHTLGGDLFITLVLSVVLHLTVELPVLSATKILMGDILRVKKIEKDEKPILSESATGTSNEDDYTAAEAATTTNVHLYQS